MQAARLTLQNYFGAREATIFSKHGLAPCKRIFPDLGNPADLFQLG